jgi:hypothetical protein
MSLPRVDDGWPPRARRRDDGEGMEHGSLAREDKRARWSYEPAYAYARDGFAALTNSRHPDGGVGDARAAGARAAGAPTTATTAMATTWCAPSLALARRGDGPETAASAEKRFAGFDRRLDVHGGDARGARPPSGSTPTLEASAPHVVASVGRPSEAAETTTHGGGGVPDFVSRLRELEASKETIGAELQSVKRMLTDIMATQSNLLAALASQRSSDREGGTRGDAEERRRPGREKSRGAPESGRRDDARFGGGGDAMRDSAIATDEDEGEMSESQLQKIVLRRMYMHQRGLNEESSQSA